jgi:uridine kinase
MENEPNPVHGAEPRKTAQVRFPDGRTFEAPVGTALEQYVRMALADSPVPVIAALVNGELRELTYPLQSDARLEPIFLSDSDGERIYRRSLAFLLVTVIRGRFPQAQVFVDYTLPFGGFFCRLRGRDPFSAEELAQIEASMRTFVEQDIPITRESVPLAEAIELFQSRGEMEKVQLLKRRQKATISLYSLQGTRDYFHGYMVPSTGYLQHFAVFKWPPGFVLQYPRRNRPLELSPARYHPQLMETFLEYGEWLRLLKIEWVSELNDAIADGRIREIVLVSEALHEGRIADIAEHIVRRMGKVRLVLIAGPSASGKTTFAKRLSIQLLAHGIRPFPLEMDNYFVDREKTPRDANGDYDFEALEALDVPLFNRHLLALMNGEEVLLPRFNFKTGRREPGEVVQLGPDHIVIVEGIHGLNPQLAPDLPREAVFRIFVSALTQLNVDRNDRVSTTDTRLIRRVVRDATYRDYSAEETLQRWESVRNGEKRFIFPYQEHADVMFNSALVYELAVLKPLTEPLLLQVEHTSPRHVEAKRLLTFLDWFESCGGELIPDNSILREFIGGSILQDYMPHK